MTRSNAEWMSALKVDGPAQAAALAELRTILLRAALFSLRRFRDSLGLLSPAEVHHLAEDCAQDAVLAILQHLEQFRGESRFTTWAYSFAINASLVAARRERWKRVPLAPLMEGMGPNAWPDGHAGETDPDRRALQGETLAV